MHKQNENIFQSRDNNTLAADIIAEHWQHTFRIRLCKICYFAALLISVTDRRDQSVTRHVWDASDNAVSRGKVLHTQLRLWQQQNSNNKDTNAISAVSWECHLIKWLVCCLILSEVQKRNCNDGGSGGDDDNNNNNNKMPFTVTHYLI